MKGNLGLSFNRLLSATFHDYKGFKGERDKDRILWKGKSYSTVAEFHEAVNQYIEQGCEAISNSLNREK